MICTDVHLHTTSEKYSWELGPCHSSLEYDDVGIYTEKCCVPNVDALLLCSSPDPHGWINSFVQIGGHQFCDDFIGYSTSLRVNIPGKLTYTNNLLMCPQYWYFQYVLRFFFYTKLLIFSDLMVSTNDNEVFAGSAGTFFQY